jgi:hypothetical protein
MRNKLWIFSMLTAITLNLVACDFDGGNSVRTGPIKDQSITLDLNRATQANVELDMAAGEMKVRGGTAKLVDAHIEYNVPEWQPQVTDSNSGGIANVVIKQPGHVHASGHDTRNTWDLLLNDQVAMDLNLSCGAGKARLELGDLNLRNVNVHMGAGEVTLSLEGRPTHDYSVDVAGGVGEATIRLPHDVGIRAEAHGGLGSIEVSGLTKHDDYYSNDLYGHSKVNVSLKVSGGIGQIRILD